MFGTDNTPGCVVGILPSALRYFLQLFLCYPVTALASLPFTALLRRLGFDGEHPGNLHFAGYEALVYLFMGGLVGWLLARLYPSLVSSGMWIWLLPVAGIVPELFRPEHPWSYGTFFAHGNNVMLVRPTSAIAGYSAGMAVWNRTRAWMAPGVPSLVRAALGLLGCLALFSLLGWQLQRYERAKIASRIKIRSVIDPGGLWVSPDPRYLCTVPASGSRRLNYLTHVERQERRACGGGRLLDPDAQLPEGGFFVDRIRVLDGPYTGLEGWVWAYGID